MKIKDLCLLWIIILILTSCITTNNIGVLNAEFFQKGMLATDSIDTIAVINRSYEYNTLDHDTFYYKLVDKDKMIKDTLVKYKELSNICTDALADYLRNTGYFKEVINYQDSLNHPVYAQTIAQRLQNKMISDACIVLSFFAFQDQLMTNSYYFDSEVIESFPEFEHSTMMETVGTYLRWSIIYKNNSSNKSLRRLDNLFYGNSADYNLFGSAENHRKLLKNTAGSLGESFANEIIPHYQKATRIYYRSQNAKMLNAQKKLLSEDYKGAAENYRPLTENKNKNIAAKSAFNMALICEIEGSLDASLDWLYQSGMIARHNDYQHASRCQEYIDQIRKRQNELETLDNQFHN